MATTKQVVIITLLKMFEFTLRQNMEKKLQRIGFFMYNVEKIGVHSNVPPQ